MTLLFRFYSGAGANIIVCDGRNAPSSICFCAVQHEGRYPTFLKLEVRTEPVDEHKFTVRERIAGLSFNEQIEREYRTEEADGELSRFSPR